MKSWILLVLAIFVGFWGFYFYNKMTSKVSDVVQAPEIFATNPPSNFSLSDAPSESVTGNIMEMSGKVSWGSRTATAPAQISNPVSLQQGEEIDTDTDGNVTAQFPGIVLLKIGANTQIDFVQTLPVEAVFAQNYGEVNYIKLADVPISVRSLHLLIRQNSGEMDVKTDKDKGTVDVKIENGSITVGYNDMNNVSQVQNFSAPGEILFDDGRRGIREL